MNPKHLAEKRWHTFILQTRGVCAQSPNLSGGRCDLYKGKSESDIISLQQYAQIINVHCRATNEHQRFYEREVAKAGKTPDWLPTHMSKLNEIYDLVRDPLDLDCPVIAVGTTDVYSPCISRVASTTKGSQDLSNV